jgi:3-hydroxyisobutyrate dehydrogenase
MTSVAFIGLGNMGAGMAANLVKTGHAVAGFDLSQDALARAREAGVTPADSVGDAAAGAEVVITMLPAGPQVREVYGSSILPAAKPGALFIDCSTIDVQSARAIAETAEAAGFDMADAPVSGGVAAAAAGSLTFMVGGSARTFARTEPVLAAMGKAVIHAGDSGAGQAAKICNNMLLGITMIGTCEAFALAEKLGLDLQRFFDIASKASGQSWSMTSYCPVPGPVPGSPANRGYQPGFTAAMMLKDLKLAQAAAAQADAATPLGAQAQALYQIYACQGAAQMDFSGIIEMLKGMKPR